jgi:hypothetical protein
LIREIQALQPDVYLLVTSRLCQTSNKNSDLYNWKFVLKTTILNIISKRESSRRLGCDVMLMRTKDCKKLLSIRLLNVVKACMSSRKQCFAELCLEKARFLLAQLHIDSLAKKSNEEQSAWPSKIYPESWTALTTKLCRGLRTNTSMMLI